jgi:hypothetical protein
MNKDKKLPKRDEKKDNIFVENVDGPESGVKTFQSKFNPLLSSEKYLERLAMEIPAFNNDKEWNVFMNKTPTCDKVQQIINDENDKVTNCYNCNSDLLYKVNNKNCSEKGNMI